MSIGRGAFARRPPWHKAGAGITGVADVGLFIVAVRELADGDIGDIERHGERMIKNVHPDRRLRSLVTMVVPMQRRRQNEVAFLHVQLFVVDGRVGAPALDDEPRGGGNMLVIGRAPL